QNGRGVPRRFRTEVAWLISSQRARPGSTRGALMVDTAASSGGLRSPSSRTFAALGHPGFRRYYVGQGVSLIGTWLQSAAVRWLVFDQTHSEFMLGIVEVAALMPGLLVGLFAGALADRIVPLTMVVLMECGQMLLAFLLALQVGLQIISIW